MTFSLRYLERIREERGEAPKEFAELKGTLVLAGAPTRVVFLPDPGEPLVEHQPEDTHVRQTLGLALESGASGGASSPLRLRLFSTKEQAKLRDAELTAALEIDGAMVAPREANDVLDLRLVASGLLQVELLDPGGRPMVDTDVVITQSNGFELAEKTDGAGLVAVRGHDRTLPVEFRVADRACLAIQGDIASDVGTIPAATPEDPPPAAVGCCVEEGEAEPVAVAAVISPDEVTALG